jgi:hypothetical protein
MKPSSAQIFAGANLSNAVFVRTHLIGVDLTRTNLSKARLANTCFEGCDTLDQAKGLQLVKHQGPSTLDALTLRSYVRNLPIQFLLGLGYTEEEIEVFYRHFTVPKVLTTRASFLMLAPMMRLLNACAVVCCGQALVVGRTFMTARWRNLARPAIRRNHQARQTRPRVFTRVG